MAPAGDALLNVEQAVRERYSAGAAQCETALCCPVHYDPQLLEVIPDEVIEKDYGCGDPTRTLQPGETVLDLGSGAGKACFIASQVVGPEGRVIGIDKNDEMLEVARRNAPIVAERTGCANVEFRKGRIQDLLLDLTRLDARLADAPVASSLDLSRLEALTEELRRTHPLVPDGSVDVVISNCVLNLVRNADKQRLFREIFRVLRRGGRAVISDIVSDEDVPFHLQNDPTLWSGCISGALREDRFLAAFEEAGFYGIELLERSARPWQVVEGIEFRAVTLQAFRGKEGPCLERRQAVIYRGPFRAAVDDDGHTFPRGERVAVCDKTFHILTRPPYAAHFEPVPPNELIPLEQAEPFPCTGGVMLRAPSETKSGERAEGVASAGSCDPATGCC
jgi:ubiquinone/menaquinone biosynthesis C-methylase UbiE